MSLSEKYYGPKKVPSSTWYAIGAGASLYIAAAFLTPYSPAEQKKDERHIPMISQRNRSGLAGLL
jgi:hypothetical protein